MKMLKTVSSIAVSMIISTTSAFAVGLGSPSLNSSLNQRLDISIPLTLNDKDKKKNFNVMMADLDTYKLMGMGNINLKSSIKVKIIDPYSDSASIKIFTSDAFRDPVLSVIVKLSVGRSTLFKHVSFIIDDVMQIKASKKVDPSVRMIPIRMITSKVNHASTPKNAIKRNFKLDDINRTYKVSSGDSLSRIAYMIQHVNGISRNDIMHAIFKMNRKAFNNGNINQIKLHAAINMPTKADIMKYKNEPNIKLHRKNTSHIPSSGYTSSIAVSDKDIEMYAKKHNEDRKKEAAAIIAKDAKSKDDKILKVLEALNAQNKQLHLRISMLEEGLKTSMGASSIMAKTLLSQSKIKDNGAMGNDYLPWVLMFMVAILFINVTVVVVVLLNRKKGVS